MEKKIKIELLGEKFYFQIFNSKGKIKNRMLQKNKGGIGIENVKKRLDLLFPRSYSMQVSDNSDSFEVKVEIKNINQVK